MTDAQVRACLTVNRCVCMNVKFAAMKQWASEQDKQVTLDDLVQQFDCTKGCGMCKPYIEHMLETGDTEIPLDGRHR